MAATITAPLTVEEFEKLPGMDGFELIDGEPRERETGNESGWIGNCLSRLLGNHVDPGRLGWVFGAEAGYICFPHRPKLLRKPDASFVARGRFEAERPPRGYARLAPDLVAEVASPNDTYEELDERIDDYLRAGVRLIWVLSPATRTVLAFVGIDKICRLTDTDELTGEPVLPGFRVRVADLFPPPPPPPGT